MCCAGIQHVLWQMISGQLVARREAYRRLLFVDVGEAQPCRFT